MTHNFYFRIQNVNVTSIWPCPQFWKDSQICIELRFGVPVDLNDDSRFAEQGYQLNSQHLTKMWERYASEYLRGLSIYVTPNTDTSVLYAILIGVGVTLVFAISLFLLRYLLVTIPEKRR